MRPIISHSTAIAVMTVAVLSAAGRASGEDNLAPCQVVASHLRTTAAAHPEAATSEASFPYNVLSRITGDPEIGYLSSQDYDSLEAVEAALAIRFSPENRRFMADSALLELADGWRVIDARSLVQRLVLYQIGGSASCYQAAIFDTSNAELKPAFSGDFGEGDVCDGFGTSFDVLRIGDLAYPTLYGGINQGMAYEFSLRVMPLSGQGINETPDLCRVGVTFGEKVSATEIWASDRPEDREAVAAVKALAAALEADRRNDETVEVQVKPFLALPDQPVGSDPFQRLAARNAPEKLQPADLLTSDEEVKLVAGLPEDDLPVDSPLLALKVGGAKVVFAYGMRHLGWRYRTYPTMRAWKWENGRATDLLSAEFKSVGRSPVITVFGPDGTVAK